MVIGAEQRNIASDRRLLSSGCIQWIKLVSMNLVKRLTMQQRKKNQNKFLSADHHFSVFSLPIRSKHDLAMAIE